MPGMRGGFMRCIRISKWYVELLGSARVRAGGGGDSVEDLERRIRIEQKLEEQARLLLEARLDALQRQINPHFCSIR